MDNSRRTPRINFERDVLRGFCQAATGSRLRAEGIRLLASYRFQLPEHQLVFDALVDLQFMETGTLRQHLATRLTVLGFPDVDLDQYFSSPPPGQRETLVLIDTLVRQTWTDESAPRNKPGH